MSNFKYYWMRFKMDVRGGWDIFKKTFEDVDFMENMRNNIQTWKENDEYEARQKRYEFFKKLINNHSNCLNAYSRQT